MPTEADLDFILALDDSISGMGGAHLADRCVSIPMVLNYPHADDGKPQKTGTCSCGLPSIFVLPYEPTEAAQSKAANPSSYVRFCVVCDLATHWPRLKEIPS